MTWKDGQLDHTAWLDMCKEGCHSSCGPTLTILTSGMVTGRKTRQKTLRQHCGAVLSSPQPLFWPHLSHIQTWPVLPQGKSQSVCIKVTLLIQVLIILELPLWKAMRRALGQRGFTWGLSQRQGCGPQWGATQRSPETRNRRSESVRGEVAPLSPTPPPDASITVWFESARSDSAHRLRACHLYSHTEFTELLSHGFP